MLVVPPIETNIRSYPLRPTNLNIEIMTPPYLGIHAIYTHNRNQYAGVIPTPQLA